jgi:hypothetical protein
VVLMRFSARRCGAEHYGGFIGVLTGPQKKSGDTPYIGTVI